MWLNRRKVIAIVISSHLTTNQEVAPTLLEQTKLQFITQLFH